MVKDKGITMIELLVSLTLAIFVLSLAFYIFQKQFKYSVLVQSKSRLQVESYTGVNLIVHDILHAGFGVRIDAKPIDARNSNPDTLILLGNALRTDIESKWSIVVRKTNLSTNLLVRKWNSNNLSTGDWIIILSDSRTFLYGPFTITGVTDVNGPDLNGDGKPDPCLNLSIPSSGISVGKASLVFRVSPEHKEDTVFYYVRNDTLYRNSDPLIDNVEDFEVSFLLDTDYNGINDTWTSDLSQLNAEQLRAQLGVVRFSVLVRGAKPDLSYTYPKKEIKIEDHVVKIENLHYHRILITKRIVPRNIR